jgi:heme A synthase
MRRPDSFRGVEGERQQIPLQLTRVCVCFVARVLIGVAASAFGLPPRPTSGVSGSAFAVITMVVLFIFLLLSLRRQVAAGGAGVVAQRERERERAAEAQGQLLSSAAHTAPNEDGCGGSGMHQRHNNRRDDDAVL